MGAKANTLILLRTKFHYFTMCRNTILSHIKSSGTTPTDPRRQVENKWGRDLLPLKAINQNIALNSKFQDRLKRQVFLKYRVMKPRNVYLNSIAS